MFFIVLNSLWSTHGSITPNRKTYVIYRSRTIFVTHSYVLSSTHRDRYRSIRYSSYAEHPVFRQSMDKTTIHLFDYWDHKIYWTCLMIKYSKKQTSYKYINAIHTRKLNNFSRLQLKCLRICVLIIIIIMGERSSLKHYSMYIF